MAKMQESAVRLREAMRQHPAWPDLKALGVWWGLLAFGGAVTLLVYRSGGPKLLLVLGVVGCIYATVRVRKALRIFRQKVRAARLR
jgi:hypothetical protein